MMPDMRVETWAVNQETLKRYFTIPSIFEVDSVLDVKIQDDGLKGVTFKERKITKPYIKNYDENENPLRWLNFNTTNWIIFTVQSGEKLVGGLTMVCKTPEIRMLNGRSDLADVWDIRVQPDLKRTGIGTKLFARAIEWSRSQGYRQLCVETQNVNMPACRFYLKQGCTLGAINRFAYRGDPVAAEEVQLIWFMDL